MPLQISTLTELQERQRVVPYLFSPANNEIYTPVVLVRNMIDKLPPIVWRNPTLKFVDPTCKSGIFLLEIVFRLWVGLKKWEPDDKKRLTHILKNMVYGYAISKTAALITRKLLYNDCKHEGNISEKLFIDETGISMKFDVIVGNPPYQKQVGPKKTEPMWHKFVEKSFDYLNAGGHLCLVHPPGWREAEGRYKKTGELMLSKNINHLEMYSKAEGVKTFSASIPYDWYVIKNVDNTGKTSVKFQDGTSKVLDLRKLPFIPNGAFDQIQSLLAKPGEERVEILWNCEYHTQQLDWMSPKKTTKFKYPIVYTIHNGDKVNLWYSSEKKGHFGTPKVIWSNGGITMGTIVDDTGKYGLSQFAYAIMDKVENLENIKKAMTSDKFKKMITESTNDASINRRVLALFRKDFWKEFV